MNLQNSKHTGRQSLKDIRVDQDWNAEETLFSDAVGQTVKSVLFPRYKFLKIGWEEYRPNVKDSLSSMMEEAMKMKQPQTNKQAMWEKVTVYTIRLKYTNMKCNINNVIKSAYKGKCCIYMQRDYFAKLNILHISICLQVIPVLPSCSPTSSKRGLKSSSKTSCYIKFSISFVIMFTDSIRIL